MRFLGLVLATGLIALSGVANATTYSLGTATDSASVSETVTFTAAPASFGSSALLLGIYDEYDFSLSSTKTWSAAANVTTTPGYIAGVQLYKEDLVTHTWSELAGGTYGAASISLAGLTGGIYKLIVNGLGFGNGSYTLNVSVSAVPLPAALPLLASALIAVGFMGRRRQNKARIG